MQEADGTVDAMKAISIVFIFVVNTLRLRMESIGSTGGDFIHRDSKRWLFFLCEWVLSPSATLGSFIGLLNLKDKNYVQFAL